jgi:hypothetical protein
MSTKGWKFYDVFQEWRGHWFFLFIANGLMSIFWCVMLQLVWKEAFDGITFLNVLENVSQAVLELGVGLYS